MSAPLRWDLLSGLTEEQQKVVLSTARSRRYAGKDVLFHEGVPGDCLFLIAEGHIAIRGLTPSGESATFAILGAGQALGEMALLRRSRTRTASAVALDDVEVLVLTRDAFFRLCEQHPVMERVMVSVLAARVDRLSQHLVDALHRPVEERLARRLLEAARLYPDTGKGILLPLTQQDIASLAGSSRPTANIVLNELQDAGILTLSRGKLVIHDLKQLAKRAG